MAAKAFLYYYFEVPDRKRKLMVRSQSQIRSEHILLLFLAFFIALTYSNRKVFRDKTG